MDLRRLLTVIAALALAISNTAPAARPPVARDRVSIGVFGLFHPRDLIITADGQEALLLQAGARHITLHPTSSTRSARITFADDELLVTAGEQRFKAKDVTVTGRANDVADFELSVPRRIQRHYRGTLRISRDASSLVPVVSMDREVAVASIVAAETSADTPVEALKAQAVAVRSYLVASGRRHEQFDFCDTTHCQFLRDAPPPTSAAARAADATRGLVLAYDSQPFAAMYTRSCSGQTHTPSELGLPAANYPYFSVECSYCRAHPDKWSSRIPLRDSRQLRSGNERSRLDIVRRLGWQAVPSNDFTTKEDTDAVLLEGIGHGHGIGLCQRGSKAMAQSGQDFRAILLQYYPNTTLQPADLPSHQ